MADKQHTFVALLRGINVSGQRKIPMAELRSVCAAIGCEDVRTYIQSGNVVCSSTESAATLEQNLEKAIKRRFRCSVPVIVRAASKWRRYVRDIPFPTEAKQEGNHVLLVLSKRPPGANAVLELEHRATKAERIAKTGDAIWIHYANGIARSKLTPAVLDRYVGSPVTARNWRTVLRLDAMVRGGR